MVFFTTGGDPMQLLQDWQAAEHPLAICELLFTKLTLSQLSALHTNMGAAKKLQAAVSGAPSSSGGIPQSSSGGGASGLSHACTLEEFQDAYHRTVNSVALQKFRDTINDRLAEIFRTYDVNGDGTLTFEEMTLLRDMLHRQGDDVDDGALAAHRGETHITKAEVTIYNELAVSVDWEATTCHRMLGEIPEWSDCTLMVYHAGIHKYSVCWGTMLIIFELTGEDLNRARPCALLKGHLSSIVACAYVPHLKKMFTCGTDRYVHAWYAQDNWGRPDRGAAVSCAQISIVYDPSSQYLFTGGTDGSIYLYPTTPRFGQPMKRIEAHSDWVNDMIIIPELECLVTCSADATVKFFSTASLELRGTKSSPQHSSGLTKVMYCRKDRAIYTSISGREVLLWSPFLPKPTERLQGHDKPIVGFTCFERRPEVVTVDISGKVCVWDMRSTTIVQTLGAPDSPSPMGPTHGFAYNPHERSIACLGEHNAFIFIPQKGSCSALLDSVVGQVVYDAVHKSIICSSGSRVVVFELTTGESRHAHAFGGVEISALACAVQQQLIIGTEEGKLMVVHMGSWQCSAQIQLKDPIRTVVDLGKKSRLSVTGECPKALALTTKGLIHVFPYGPLANAVGEPVVNLHTEFAGLEFASYSSKHGLMFMARKQMLEVWDVVYSSRKTVQGLPSWITAVKCVDDVDATFFGTSDGSVHCFHSVSCVPSFVLQVAPTPVNFVSPSAAGDAGASWWGSNAVRDFVPQRFAFDRVNWSLAVMSSDATKVFAMDNILRRIAMFHQHSGIMFGGSTKVVHQRYTVDLTAVEVSPVYTYQCRSKFHTHLVLSLMVCPLLGGKETAEADHERRLERILDFKIVQRKRSMSKVKIAIPVLDEVGGSINSHRMSMSGSIGAKSSAAGEDTLPFANNIPDFERLVSAPLEFFTPAANEKLDLQGGRGSLYAVHHFMPSHRRAVPVKYFPHLAMMDNPPALSTASVSPPTSPLKASRTRTKFPAPLSSVTFIGDEEEPPGAARSPSLREKIPSAHRRRSSVAPSPEKERQSAPTAGLGARRASLAPHHLLEALRQSQMITKPEVKKDEGQVNTSPAITEAIVELKWMVVCMAMSLHQIHAKRLAGLCHPDMVRYVAPYYTMFLSNGLWALGEDATGALPPHLMPPEGLTPLGASADVWLIGLTLFKAVVGRDFLEPNTGRVNAFDAITRALQESEHHVYSCYRTDGLLMALQRRCLCAQASRRATVSELLGMLEGFWNPPRHLTCVPLEPTEAARHELFVVKEKDASLKHIFHPAIEDAEYQCITVCEVPALYVMVEFNGLSAHVVLWSDEPKLVGVTPPNSTVATMYNVGREEVTSVRQTRISASDLSVLDDPSLVRRGVYRVERFCPFFTETKTMDAMLGKVVQALPKPYYLEGWHKMKNVAAPMHHQSQKHRDMERKKRWADANATAKTTSFEKILLTAKEPTSPQANAPNGTQDDDGGSIRNEQHGASPSGGNVMPLDFTIKISTKLDSFLLGRNLNPHWSKTTTRPSTGGTRPSTGGLSKRK
jgi:WD40 repeat protein